MSWVYVLKNTDGRFDGLYKIGHTTRANPEDRAKEITNSTGVIGTFEVEGKYQVYQSERVEQHVHRLLAHKRYQNDREFFEATLGEIDTAIREAVDDLDDHLGPQTEAVVTEEELERIRKEQAEEQGRAARRLFEQREAQRQAAIKREAEEKARVEEANLAQAKRERELKEAELHRQRLLAVAQHRVAGRNPPLPANEEDAAFVLRHCDKIKSEQLWDGVWSLVKGVAGLGFLGALFGGLGETMALIAWIGLGLYLWNEGTEGKPARGSDEYYRQKAKEEASRQALARTKAANQARESSKGDKQGWGGVALAVALVIGLFIWDHYNGGEPTRVAAASLPKPQVAYTSIGQYPNQQTQQTLEVSYASQKKTFRGNSVVDFPVLSNYWGPTGHALNEYKHRPQFYCSTGMMRGISEQGIQERLPSFGSENWHYPATAPEEALMKIACPPSPTVSSHIESPGP